MTYAIALVDSNQDVALSLTALLKDEGYCVETYADGDVALVSLRRRPVNLVISDINLPRMGGFEFLRNLRAKDNVPVIFLTDMADEVDEVMALHMGADDYIKKPFSQRLLLERIRAILRRQEFASREKSGTEVLRRGDLALDPSRHRCTWKEKEVSLTSTEFLLTVALAQRPGHVKNRDQLMEAAYGRNFCVSDRTIDSHIKRLRKKFKEITPDFSAIETLYGVGYRYCGA
jgi:two-component system response regulator ChvI